MKLPDLLFRAPYEAFFATTFTFDQAAFDDYFFPRLGAPPLNAVVLADANRLDDFYRSVAERDAFAEVRRAGHHYLLRPVTWGGHAFHAKTYLSGTRKKGQLAVGSGNLQLAGLSEGNEVACAFMSDNPVGVSAIAAWVRWMNRVVAWCADDLLDQRWATLLSTLPWLQEGDERGSVFRHTLDTSLIDQFLDAAPSSVDELIFGAPFYDADAAAIGGVVLTLKPKRITCLLADQTSVDGHLLRSVLEGSGAAVQYLRPQPNTYVHAKLLTAIAGEDALLLSGSANLSRAALMFSGQFANCEVAILTRAPADVARSTLRGRLAWQAVLPAELDAYSYNPLTDAALPAGFVRLFAARSDEEPARLTLRGRGRLPAGGAQVRLLRVAGSVDIGIPSNPDEEWSFSAVLPSEFDADLPSLAQIWAGGIAISNIVPVDNPRALTAMLGSRRAAEAPGDDLPGDGPNPAMSEFVAWLRRSTDFSILGGLGVGGIHQPGQRRNVEDDPELVADDLELTIHKRRGTRWQHGPGVRVDELLAALALLGAQIPRHLRPRIYATSDPDIEPTPPPPPTGPPTPQLSRRLGNALEKMCNAATDRRLYERDPDGSIKNVVALVEALWLLENIDLCRSWVPLDRRRTLLKIIVQGLAGNAGTAGLLSSLDTDELAEVIGLMGADFPELVADLVLGSLRPDGRLATRMVFEWQQILRRSLALGICRGRDPKIDAVLVSLTDYTDDEHWTADTAETVGIAFQLRRKPDKTWLVLKHDPRSLFDDPAVTALLSAWSKKTGEGSRFGVQVDGPHPDVANDDWRLAVSYGQEAWGQWPGGSAASTEPITAELLDRLACDGMTLRSLFPSAPRPAALSA